MTRCRIVVMAKAPVPGYAKTRLIPALGAQGAAALATRLLSHALAQAQAAQLGVVELCCAPHHDHERFQAFADAGMALSTQTGGDLGARMAHAFERNLALADQVLMMGTDAPALDAALLQRAAQALVHTDAVFVPALDGGYALIGLRRPTPELFQSMAWSTPTVMAHTRERIAAAGLRHMELPAVADIDEPADLIHTPREWLA